MPKSVNKVILLGNVGKDPEVKFLPSGLPVANLTLATSDRFKDKAGEWQDRTEWHNLTAYQRVAEIIRDYVKKGSKLYVEGRIQTRSWDDQASGQKKYRTEIIVNDVVLLSGRGEGEGAGGSSRSNTSFLRSTGARAPRGVCRYRNHGRRYSVLTQVSVPASTLRRLLLGCSEDDSVFLAPLPHNFAEGVAAKSVPLVPQAKMPQLILESTKCPAASNGVSKSRPDIIPLNLIAELGHDVPFIHLPSARKCEITV